MMRRKNEMVHFFQHYPSRREFKIFLLFLLFSLTGHLQTITAQNLFVNEFLASNSSVNRDPDFNQFADWVEIYNPNAQAVDLSGYFLSDDFSDPGKWQIPAGTSIQGGGFLLFWADGNDTTLLGCHTNFKLKKDGEQIALYYANGTLLDSLSYSSQTSDVSFGRQPDGSANWQFFSTPTPAASNNSDLFLKAAAPTFSLDGGYYTTAQMLSISDETPESVVRYTLDCREPDETSPRFTSPLLIKDRSGDPNYFSEILTTLDPPAWLPDWVPPEGEVYKVTIVRARAFRTGYLPSEVVTKTYFIDPNLPQRYGTIAVISLVSDPKNLFNDTTGIYVPGIFHKPGKSSGNYFQDWEKPAHIEFFEPDGKPGFAQDIGIKIQGGTSPSSPQKGLHVIARSEYGRNRIEYPIFKNRRTSASQITEFKRFMIRAWGSVVNFTLLSDAFAQLLMAKSDLDLMAYRPAIVFLNGEYWGLHELREFSKNNWYYQYHYNIDRDNPGIDLLEHRKRGDMPYVSPEEGDTRHWDNLMTYLNTHDMSLSENYNYIKTQIDVENFISYIGHGVYLGKWDWPNNNEASWRPRTVTGKWRWIPYDMETGFGVAAILGAPYTGLGPQYNMLKHVIHGTNLPGFGQYGPHPVLVKLLANGEFKSEFIDWFVSRMQTTFAPDTMIALLDEMVAELRPYFAEHRRRWPYQSELNNDWDFSIDLLKNFARNRPNYVRQHLEEEFGITGLDSKENETTAPLIYRLFQNYPNPFNPETTIRYSLKNAGKVVLKIFTIDGRETATPVNQLQTAGEHWVKWNGAAQASGVYFYRLTTDHFTRTRKMLLLR